MYSNYRPYPPQQIYPQQNTNNRVQPTQGNNQPNMTFNQQPIQSPKQSNRLGRAMYSSTIQPTTSPSNNLKSGGFGFGKLQSMGRFIQEVPDTTHKTQEVPKVINSQPVQSFKFGNDNHERVKMSSSVIFNKSNEDELNRFPSFNMNNSNQDNGGLSKLQAFMNRKQVSLIPSEEIVIETPEQKRKREIMTIKQQLQFLNKKIEKTGLRKVEGNDADKKPYFQLPTRKGGSVQSTNNSVNGSSSDSNEQFNKQKDINPQVTQVTNNSETLQSHSYQKNFQNQSLQPQSNPSNRNNGHVVGELKIQKSSALVNPIENVTFVGTANSVPMGQGGMFKKKNKNTYINEQLSKPVDYQQKPIFLPTKTITTVTPNTVSQFKAVQVVENTKFKQPMRRAVTLDYEAQKSLEPEGMRPKLTATGPRQFKKSDFAIGKKTLEKANMVQHKQTGFLMGLKVMSKKQIREQRYQNQIARQLSINFYLAHRNIAPLYGYFSDEENVYLLVEYCTNGQLLSLLRKNRRMEDPEVSPIIKQICEGLDYIHKEGIIHRDIKPENILFNFNTVKICDFGWAVYSANGMRKTVSGSPLYYSPEVVLETAYDEKIDIWAIGMMTYECLLGKIPFRIYSELDLNRIVEDEIKFPEYVDVTDDAKDFILKIMKKKPEERMQIKEIMRHPFITKYLKAGKLSGQIMEEFRKVI